MAKPHIFSRGETSPAVTWCSLTNCGSYSRLSPLLPWLLGRLLPHFFTPAATRQCVEQSKISLTTEEKQAKEKKNNGERMLSLTRAADLGELCSLWKKKKSLRTTALFRAISRPHGADFPGLLWDVTERPPQWLKAETALPCFFSMWTQ